MNGNRKTHPVKRRKTSGKATSASATTRRAIGAERGSLESGLYKLATSGELSKAARAAIKKQQKQGLPITFQRGDQIIKQYADGREDILATLPRQPYVRPKGVKVIGRS
jgi:hypothetical protein